MEIKDIIMWSNLSRMITGGSRWGIRDNKIPKRRIPALDKLFLEEIPGWWLNKRSEIIKEDD